LSKHHRVTLACPLEGPAELAAAGEFRAVIPDLECAAVGKLKRYLSVFTSLAGTRPLSLGFFACRSLLGRVSERFREESFDLVYVSSSSAAQYSTQSGVRTLVDFIDVDSEKWAQFAVNSSQPFSWIYRLEARRLRRYEIELSHQARLSLFATVRDQRIFRQFAPDAESAVVLNGVDLDYFCPGNRHSSGPPTIIFTGALDYFPNADAVRWFAKQVLPLIRRSVHNVRFLVVGRRPGRMVRQIGLLQGVEVISNVPDVRPYMRAADVAVVPLRIASGIQNKALEAMAMGLPVVASLRTAEGIDASASEEWFVEKSPDAYADRIVSLLQDPVTRSAVGSRGRAFVERKHSWDKILPEIDDLLVRAAA
jgi:sugar transferase (PEP-CTERM/EpsH1 system associated)